jgi:hypothetical protein
MAEEDGGFTNRTAARALVAALFFAAGVIVGTVPAARIIAADEGRRYPDTDRPNVFAGMVMQVV